MVLNRATCAAFLASLLAASFLTATEESELQIIELSSNIFAVLQPAENRFNQSNSLFAIREKDVLVVDTQSTLKATRQVIAEIRERTDLPVRKVVLTHWHGDHVQGIAALVYFPAQGILVTGDVVDDLPFGGHGYPASWLETLDDLLELEIKSIVPGHGRVRRGKEHLRGLRGMFKALVEETQRAVADELDLEATRARVLDALAPFHEKLAGTDEVAARAWDAFIPATIERAWAEARDDTID